MPNIKSAKKALRQSKRHRERNLVKKNAFKDALRKYRKLIAGQKLDEAKKLLPDVYKKLDKAAKTNVIQKNKASRLKSRMAKKVIQKS